ncbi:DUF5652 family protein [soil metagenome]
MSYADFMNQPWLVVLVSILAVWDGVWKAVALWHAGRNAHLGWFIALCIFNTLGILPIIYIFAVGRPALRASRS